MFQSHRFPVALVVSVSALHAQAAAPAICEQDNGKYIVDCAKTCRAACDDAHFLTGNHTQACARLIPLDPEQLTDKAECTPPKALCEELIPDDSLPTPPNATKPPDCFKSFPHLSCQAEVIKAELEKISTDITPLLGKVDISKFTDDSVICKYSKQEFDDIFNTSEQLKTIYRDSDNRRMMLQKCINSTNDWVQAWRCPAGAPESLCRALPEVFRKKNDAAKEKMAQSNKKASDLTQNIEKMQAGISFISQVYKYACPKPRR